jgi:hypothetical protein
MIIKHKDRAIVGAPLGADYYLSIDDGHRTTFGLSLAESRILVEDLLHFIHEAGRPTLNSFPSEVSSSPKDSNNSGFGPRVGRELSATCECPACRPNKVFVSNWPRPPAPVKGFLPGSAFCFDDYFVTFPGLK